MGAVLAVQTPVRATAADPCVAATTSETTASTPTSDAAATETSGDSTDVTQKTVVETAAVAAKLRLSELLPNPAGDDTAGEFIEVENFGTTDADLSGWKIIDAKSHSFALPSGLLAAGAFRQFAYTDSRLTLTNSGMTLSLVAPDGTTADTVTYGAAAESKSYARASDGSWAWNCVPTPGAANDVAGFAAASTTASTGTTSSAASTSASTTNAAATASTTTAGAAAATSTTTASTVTTTPATVTATATVPSFDKTDLAIAAFLPHPASGGSEWIELINNGTASATLTGWHLDDEEGGSKPFALDGVTLAAGEQRRLLQTQTKIGLNDDGDEVRLLAADGTLVMGTSYVKAPVGVARVSVGGTWSWENALLPTAATTVAETTATASTADTSSEPASADSTDAASLAPVQAITLAASTADRTPVTATVTLPPGKVGTSTFAVLTDGGVGMFVRAYGNPMPALASGDRLAMAIKTTASGGITAATVRTKDMTVISHGLLAVPTVPTEEVTTLDNGRLVLLHGTVTAGGKRWLTISPDGQDSDVTVTLVSGEVPAGKQEGSLAEVTGIARLRNGKTEILAENSGLKLTPATVTDEDGTADATAAAAANTGADGQPAKPSRASSLTAVMAPIGGAIASAYALWRKRRGVVEIPS